MPPHDARTNDSPRLRKKPLGILAPELALDLVALVVAPPDFDVLELFALGFPYVLTEPERDGVRRSSGRCGLDFFEGGAIENCRGGSNDKCPPLPRTSLYSLMNILLVMCLFAPARTRRTRGD
jgi:hypothetical protein